MGAFVLWQSAGYCNCLGRGALGWNTYVSPVKRVLRHLLWLGPFEVSEGILAMRGPRTLTAPFFIFQSKTILWDYWKIEESIYDPTILAHYHHFWCIAFHYYKCRELTNFLHF